jgi:hypothetical protein
MGSSASSRRVVCDPAGRPGALLDLALGLDDRLAHLAGEDRGVAGLVRPQHPGNGLEQRRPVLDARVAPAVAHVPGFRQRRLDFGVPGLRKTGQLLAG